MKSKSAMSRWVLGVVVAASLPVAQAMAGEPPPAEVKETAPPPAPRTAEEAFPAEQSAAARAQQWEQKAERYQAMGAPAYKAGLVQYAQGMAAKYSRQAALERARAAVDPAVLQGWDAEAARYESLAREYRQLGGMAYKAGLVQWAEAQARKYEMAPLPVTVSSERLFHTSAPFKPWLN